VGQILGKEVLAGQKSAQKRFGGPKKGIFSIIYVGKSL
jgi:hypothetical protein